MALMGLWYPAAVLADRADAAEYWFQLETRGQVSTDVVWFCGLCVHYVLASTTFQYIFFFKARRAKACW